MKTLFRFQRIEESIQIYVANAYERFLSRAQLIFSSCESKFKRAHLSCKLMRLMYRSRSDCSRLKLVIIRKTCTSCESTAGGMSPCMPSSCLSCIVNAMPLKYAGLRMSSVPLICERGFDKRSFSSTAMLRMNRRVNNDADAAAAVVAVEIVADARPRLPNFDNIIYAAQNSICHTNNTHKRQFIRDTKKSRKVEKYIN